MDGSTDSFGYDAAGRLTTKTNAGVRGVRFDYDTVGNLTNIVYPGDPAVSFSYDDLNRRTRMVDGVGTTTWTHASSCLPETSADGPFSADSVAQGFDGARRLTNLVYAGLTVPYGLDALGRIVTVGGDATNAFAWLGQSFLVLINARSAGTVTEYRYDALLHLTNVLHRLASGASVQRFGVAYNDADERTRVAREDGHYRDYGYDPVGQLMSAQGYESGGAKRPGYGYAYAYDPAGNPLRQERNGFVTSNAFNNLNQNTTSRWSGAVAVAGAANLSNGTVTVNGVAAALRPAYDGGVLFAATNIAVSTGTNVLTAIHTDPFGRAATSRVTVVAQNAGYGFDRYGNLTNDGQFAYVWDDADRLKQVRSLSSGASLLQCRYDGIGRRVERVEQGVTNRYVYSGPSVGSGWLVLAVLSGSNTVRETYRHGPDLSGNLGGAGGIGSILSVSNATAGTHAYHFDFNGNVTLTTAKTGAVAAVSSWIEYGPFGEMLAKSGLFEPSYRFSSKEWDATVGLSYYGFRAYSPTQGRWLSRDPIEEEGGLNVYCILRNQTHNRTDYFGLADTSRCSSFADGVAANIENQARNGAGGRITCMCYTQSASETEITADTGGVLPSTCSSINEGPWVPNDRCPWEDLCVFAVVVTDSHKSPTIEKWCGFSIHCACYDSLKGDAPAFEFDENGSVLMETVGGVVTRTPRSRTTWLDRCGSDPCKSSVVY